MYRGGIVNTLGKMDVEDETARQEEKGKATDAANIPPWASFGVAELQALMQKKSTIRRANQTININSYFLHIITDKCSFFFHLICVLSTPKTTLCT